jgi:hypothetical protein
MLAFDHGHEAALAPRSEQVWVESLSLTKRRRDLRLGRSRRRVVLSRSRSSGAPMQLLMLLSVTLYGCAYAPVPSPQLDARTLCQQQAQASATEVSDTQKDAYFDQCMIESSKEKPKAEH